MTRDGKIVGVLFLAFLVAVFAIEAVQAQSSGTFPETDPLIVPEYRSGDLYIYCETGTENRIYISMRPNPDYDPSRGEMAPPFITTGVHVVEGGCL